MISAGPPKAASGRPPPSTFPKHDRSGVDAVAALGAGVAEAEPGDDLVDDQQGAGVGAAAPEAVEEAAAGGMSPMLAGTPSTITAATLAPWRAKASSRAASSL